MPRKFWLLLAAALALGALLFLVGCSDDQR